MLLRLTDRDAMFFAFGVCSVFLVRLVVRLAFAL